MAAETSFYFSIFKKIQVCAGAANSYPHYDPTYANSETFYNLATSDSKGIFAPLNAKIIKDAAFNALLPLVSQPDPNNPGGVLPAYPLLPASDPHANVPEANPLYAMFKASLHADGSIVVSYWDTLTVAVQNSAQPWPIMPQCADVTLMSDLVKMWLEFNKPGPFTLVGALGEWIGKGKVNDTPTSSLAFTKPPQSSMQHPVLFVCSKVDDDGVRPGTGLDHFWATSQIFLVYPSGPFIGSKAYPTKLLPTDEYNIVAQIGNSGAMAGRATDLSSPPVTARAEAFPFNTFMAVAGFTLPSLANFDPASPNGIYEQYVLGGGAYSLAGFRFNANDVFNGLESALKKAIIADPSIDLAGMTPQAWLAGSHPCVKVRIAGDLANNPQPDDGDSPKSNRRIAQRNLAVFDHDSFLPQPSAPPPSPWHNFMVEQPLSQFDHGIGESTVRLTLQSSLPPEAFKLLLAIPPLTFKRYFVGEKGLRGFRVVPDEELEREIGRGRLKPFADAVVLRATSQMSTLEYTVNAKHRVLGMSLGIVHDAARHPTRPTGAVSMIHDALPGRVHEGKVRAVGGFTIEIGSKRIDRG